MKKKFMFLISACLSVVMAHAVTYPYLTFQTSNGTTVSMATSSLIITFADGKLVATNGTQTKELSVADLSSMYFSTSEATGIKDVVVTDDDGVVEAFSLQGVSFGKFDNLQALQTSVPTGVYIVKTTSGKTVKFSVK